MRHQQNKKKTAWKKSRTFGDIKGGRMRIKLKDNIVKREHSLLKPTEFDKCPIYIMENPSRDYFPITIDHIESVLNQLPEKDVSCITHIWLRKPNSKVNCQSYFTTGSGVYAIILYPFPKNNKISIGKSKPSHKLLTWYKGYASEPVKERDNWYIEFTEENARRYYLERLLMHEIGHCVNVWLVYNKAANYKSENSADNYALNNKLEIMEQQIQLNDHNKQEYPPMHTAEHLLNATMVKTFGCPRSRNAHIERKKSKCDYILSSCPTAEQIQSIEDRVNEVISQNLPVTVEFMTHEQAKDIVDLSKLPADASETLRIVRIGDYDACACIGLHVSHTSEVGTFKIISYDYDEERQTLRIRFKLIEKK